MDLRVLLTQNTQELTSSVQPQDIIRTNVLTNIHEDLTIAIFGYNFPTPGGHVFQQTGTILKLIQVSIKTIVLTNCYEDWTINVTFKVLTSFYKSNIWQIAPSPSGHVCQQTGTIFKIVRDIIGENAPPNCGNVFQATGTMFELIQFIINSNVMTKFHEDWTIHVTFRVKNVPPTCALTNLRTRFHEDEKINAPPPLTIIIFELIQYVIGTYFVTKFHEYRTINLVSMVLTRNAPPNCGHVFQQTETIFKLIKDIIRTNLLTKCHEDQTINVVSRVLTRKNAPPLGSHVFQASVTIFELIHPVNKQMLTPHNARRTPYDGHNVIRTAHHEHTMPK
ncbi:hypothetical protein DPMN_072368 [Dreissena polymorpha]|uniref:Uncharacterized protein n=1 Tax=Dreissena polymorpha TaxID=45954 RepID=A0A9D3Z8E7_DREPO|nr:hypothetical protein DPMN_072368 [Dreissena polymorpha]